MRKGILKYGKQAWVFIRKTDANTAETNFNVTSWTVGAIVVFTIIGGALWFIFGNATSQLQNMSTSVFSQLSSQTGLNTMATNAENQLAGMNAGKGSTFTGGFTAP